MELAKAWNCSVWEAKKRPWKEIKVGIEYLAAMSQVAIRQKNESELQQLRESRGHR